MPCGSGVFPRLIAIPERTGCYMLAEELILHYLPLMFPGYRVVSKTLARITRSADIDADALYDEDLDYREFMADIIRQRKRLSPVRIELSRALDDYRCIDYREIAILDEQLSFLDKAAALAETAKSRDIAMCRPKILPMESRELHLKGAFDISFFRSAAAAAGRSGARQAQAHAPPDGRCRQLMSWRSRRAVGPPLFERRFMNRNELIEQVAMHADLSKAKAAKAVETVFAEITRSLQKGEDVTLVGFGTFTVTERAERQCRNPRTGEAVTVPAQKHPKFRVGKALKDAVQ